MSPRKSETYAVYSCWSSVRSADVSFRGTARACAVLDCWRQGIAWQRSRLLDACFRVFARCAKKKIFNSFTLFSR